MPETAALAHRRQIARHWRLAFIVYAMALTAATHWPSLELGGQVPASDKTLHLLAFGVLTWLLWRTGWIGARWIVVILALLWAMADESTQALPGLNRHITWSDFLAGALGIITIGAWLWALRPAGGRVNRMRLALHRYAFERLFAPLRTWLVFAGALLACAVPAAILWFLASPPMTSRAIIVSFIVFTCVSIGILLRQWKQQRLLVAYEQRCFACDGSCIDVTFKNADEAKCPTCGGPVNAGQWTDPPPPGTRTQLGLIAWPLIAAALVVVASVLVLLASSYVYDWMIKADPTAGVAPRIARFIGTLPPELTRTVDLTLLLLLFAIATRVYRIRLARFYDQAILCRKCGHDLRGTPTEKGLGRCGECGTGFVRDGPLSQRQEERI